MKKIAMMVLLMAGCANSIEYQVERIVETPADPITAPSTNTPPAASFEVPLPSAPDAGIPDATHEAAAPEAAPPDAGPDVAPVQCNCFPSGASNLWCGRLSWATQECACSGPRPATDGGPVCALMDMGTWTYCCS